MSHSLLFSPELLSSVNKEGGAVIYRPLARTDHSKGFCDSLLSQLTETKCTEAVFLTRFNELKASGSSFVIVAEDKATQNLLGTATVFITKRFIHSAGSVGHVEDVVVDSAARGKAVGKGLVNACVSIAKTQGCYKVILDCSDKNAPFYEKAGFVRKELQMAKYLNSNM